MHIKYQTAKCHSSNYIELMKLNKKSLKLVSNIINNNNNIETKNIS